MKNKYRLSSNAFERESEEDKVDSQKIFFLSVEGNATEKEYFEGISANRRLMGIIPEAFIEKYGIDFIRSFLQEEKEITKKQKNEFITDLLKIGYDINYRKYLQKYNTELDDLVF